MSDRNEDPQLRAALSELRAHDRAPPFEASWRAAETRARNARRARAAIVLAAAAIAALAILFARPWIGERIGAEPAIASIDREPLAILMGPLPRLDLEVRR